MCFKTIVLFLGCFVLNTVNSNNDVLPAVPLVVKGPYLSTWMTSKQLMGNWPRFWTGDINGMAGLIRFPKSGKTYEFMGSPTQDNIGTKLQAKQTSLKVTPTQSVFTFEAESVELTVNFFTPIDPTDLKKLSLPASYIAISARTLNGYSHEIQVYMDISGEWASGDQNEVIEWDINKVNVNLINANIKLKNQTVFQENRDAAQWGTVKFFTDSAVYYEANGCPNMRTKFVQTGRLDNTVDKNYRKINDNWPGIAFSRSFMIASQISEPYYYGIAHVRRPAIEYTDSQLNQLWESYFNGDDNKMIDFVITDARDALKRANDLDTKISNDARRVGGESYVKVVSAALRQAYGGTEMVGTPEKPWMMLKEISSSGKCQTVDAVYPHFPVQLYLNPKLIKYLLDPLLDNQERGFFPMKYCTHDLGNNYPKCIGHIDGRQMDMEVEESANILIMMSAYVRAANDKQYALDHYKIAKQWANYLVDHGLITGNALTTDAFLGKIKNSTNLSVKAIIGIGAMAQLAEVIGNKDDQAHYRRIAEQYVIEWMRMGQDPSNKHLKLSYNTPDTWSMVYNLYADVLLDTKLIPQSIYKQQDEWYLKIQENFGVPLESGNYNTKFDWVMFTAASSTNTKLRQSMFERTAQWLRETNSNVPFSDWVNTKSGDSPGFANRPVIGGVFAPLTVKYENREKDGDSPNEYKSAPMSLGAIVAIVLGILVAMSATVLFIYRKRLPLLKQPIPPNLTIKSFDVETNESDVRSPRFQVSEEIINLLRTQRILIERKNLVLDAKISKGNFGQVYKALLYSSHNKTEKDVAVKTIIRDEMDVESFLKEGLIMKDFTHQHVLTLIGICFEDRGIPMVVLPYMANGDLLSYIRNGNNKPTVKLLLMFAIQIAMGMDYLSGQRYVHRDLAARNCVLDSDLFVKVADFGLSRDIYETDYYRSGNEKRKLPVKWMSPESIEKGIYNTKTDVWSYGVLVWELFTRGVTPYPDLDNSELLNYLKQRRRLTRPFYCPVQVYYILLRCWSNDHQLRPIFTELVTEVEAVITQLEKEDANQQANLDKCNTYINYPVSNIYYAEIQAKQAETTETDQDNINNNDTNIPNEAKIETPNT